MLSKSRSMPVQSAAPGVIPDTVTGFDNTPPPAAETGRGAPEASEGTEPSPATSRGETRGQHFRRKARRSRLHGYAIATVALVAYLIALGASNTATVGVNWVFGTSRVALVWLVLFASILGWLLGMAAVAAFHWRTRAPRAARRGR